MGTHPGGVGLLVGGGYVETGLSVTLHGTQILPPAVCQGGGALEQPALWGTGLDLLIWGGPEHPTVCGGHSGARCLEHPLPVCGPLSPGGAGTS